jgi:hypothetical protein
MVRHARSRLVMVRHVSIRSVRVMHVIVVWHVRGMHIWENMSGQNIIGQGTQ